MPTPTTTPKTVQITFDPATKSITCPNRVELAHGETIEWTLTGAKTFYLQFVEFSAARDGGPGGWPFRGGDATLFRADGKSSGTSAQAGPAVAWTTTVENPSRRPRVLKYTIVVGDGTAVYTLDPNVVIDPM